MVNIRYDFSLGFGNFRWHPTRRQVGFNLAALFFSRLLFLGSNTHANHQYATYYTKPDEVVEGFKKATEILGLKGPRIVARLPGRNTWRVGDIVKNDLGSGKAADLLAGRGYVIYGWDVEWGMTAGKPREEPEEVVKRVKSALSGEGIKTKKKDNVIILMHDTMFRNSTGGKMKLELFIDMLTQAKFKFDFVSNY